MPTKKRDDEGQEDKQARPLVEGPSRKVADVEHVGAMAPDTDAEPDDEAKPRPKRP